MAVTINGTTGLTANGSVFTDSSGNVGIGTSSPAGRLDVKSTSAGTVDMRLSFSSTDYLGFQTTSPGYMIAVGNASSTSVLAFGTQNTERMRIDSSGRLLVGTTTKTDAQRLNIAYDNDAYTGFRMYCNSATYNGAAIDFLNASGTRVGYILPSASATTYSTSSDYRLKDNVQPMTGALSKVAQLKPVTFNWTIDGSDGQGFIAHELQEVCPDAVSGKKDAVDADGNPVYQGIDTSFLVATLTAAIQEQQALITALTARIEALEAK